MGDYALVEREQVLVQKYIGLNPPSSYVRTQIFTAFSPVGRPFMPNYLRGALELTEAANGGSDYDFWNLNHRIQLGVTLMNRARRR